MSNLKEVYFVATCLVDVFYPEVGIAGMQLLRRNKINVIYPKNQTCCAQPAFNAGCRQDAIVVARTLMKCFTKKIPIVIPSGSCADMIKNHWEELFEGEDDLEQALEISKRVFELTEFLVDKLKIKLSDLGEPIKVAIHSSCSCTNGLQVADRIDKLVGQLANVEILQQKRKTECCGFGGTFTIKQADISGAMVNDKVATLSATKAEIVISQDMGCLMNIDGAIQKQQLPIKCQHIAQFLWQRTNEPS